MGSNYHGWISTLGVLDHGPLSFILPQPCEPVHGYAASENARNGGGSRDLAFELWKKFRDSWYKSCMDVFTVVLPYENIWSTICFSDRKQCQNEPPSYPDKSEFIAESCMQSDSVIGAKHKEEASLYD